ncbi:hypothetical protein FZC78_03670 [Rossellomorea vietnamensis]|uniref:Uncharacterized protein n=1 Tax=Rossellomorea vietnamensis TaxID=218284 RepID=A0A5D4P1I1_9BACI|nr:hypothetical protein [Rossellomorea vietnamensis]TYS18632.1 hypothetical protein FZC78_03670 [Rossellomorea vietnamensis]
MKEILFDNERYTITKRVLFIIALAVFQVLTFYTENKVDEWVYLGVMLTAMMIFMVCKFIFYDRKIDVSEIIVFILLAGFIVYTVTHFDTLTHGVSAP